MFIGKASLAKVFMFGYMFRNLYIPVNRKSPKSRHETIVKSMEAVDNGRGLAIFPEGTIPSHNNPYLSPFKDGAFRIAIEKKVPIVPVTIPFNWKILPDDGDYTPIKHLMRLVVHEPIYTDNMTLDDVDKLRKMTYDIINEEILKQNNLPILNHN
jgi:1-acyl-sn-glycerol-3-phosphate acyltransferase